MAIVTNALVQALFTGWKGDFQKGLEGAPSQYTKIATVVSSATKSNTYGWLGKMPKLTEWIGKRAVSKIKEHGYSITNKKWADGVEVDRDDIEDDNVGIYSPLFEELGRSAIEQKDEITFGALTNGFSSLCYDGQNFFDKSHPVAENVDGSGSVKQVSNITEDDTASTATPWFLLDTSRAIKPIIFQERRKPNVRAKTNLNEGRAYDEDVFEFGADSRNNVGYSFWQLAHAGKCKLTAENLWKAITAMRSVTGDGNKKLSIRPTVLVVPPALEKEATRLLERELTAENGVTVDNEFKGKLELIVADYL
ncbi:MULTISPECIES: Mu-like prophage major head subunit gpT family protein [Glaesserella]|uniref:Head protein n=1 Tax=Glaesserella australis TaxID=2094024 RepID=A0A328BYF1_9PAST|nr:MULTISPECIES: Mu-like prophage major head subunit gpT family protein [Glaesserella]AUI65205.1 head protein [Glaesserella sp. 15-184]RAL18477.1 head protein [Glaesserella australis]